MKNDELNRIIKEVLSMPHAKISCDIEQKKFVPEKKVEEEKQEEIVTDYRTKRLDNVLNALLIVAICILIGVSAFTIVIGLQLLGVI